MCGKSLYLSQFCCESKTALKNKILKYLKCLSTTLSNLWVLFTNDPKLQKWVRAHLGWTVLSWKECTELLSVLSSWIHK